MRVSARLCACASWLAVVGCAGPVDVDVVRVPAPRADAPRVVGGFVDDDGVAAVAEEEEEEEEEEDVFAVLRDDIAADARAAVAHARAAGLVDDDRAVFSVIDFSLPSTERRLWVFDLARGALVLNDRVSHGSGSSSDDDPARADRFSNTPGSLMSSLGLSRTAETYEGNNGYSLRLDGLEPSNDQMRDRAIVVHGAAYAEDDFVDDNGYLGRSSGCPAVAMSRSAALIDVIKEGTLLFQWFPDESWRSTSPFLQ